MIVGEYTYGSENIKVNRFGPKNRAGPHPWSGSRVKIGNFCSVGRFCNIYINENHRSDWVTTYPFGTTNVTSCNLTNFNKDLIRTGIMSKGNGSVNIGNDVWIGEHVSIMSGLTIGHGAVIAAFAHVVKDVEPYSIVGGNPAKHLKYRFSKEQIENLLNIGWWDWPMDKINEYLPLMLSDNIDEFTKKVLENN
jgi:acetyltransferase-like isoleucine patch superfamily enzyme